VLVTLSNDKEWSVRRSVAQNASTPMDALIVLSRDSNWIVREFARALIH